VTNKELLHVTDWYPTLINLAGEDFDFVLSEFSFSNEEHKEQSVQTIIYANFRANFYSKF